MPALALLLQAVPSASPVADPARAAWEWGGALGLACLAVAALAWVVKSLWASLEKERVEREALEGRWREEQRQLIADANKSALAAALAWERVAEAMRECPVRQTIQKKEVVS